MRLMTVYQNGIEMLQKVVTGCNKAHPNAIKIVKLGHSSQSKKVHGGVDK